MIVFGSRKVLSDAERLNHPNCRKCGKNTLEYRTVFSYLHLYWIPTLPGRREHVISCRDCGDVVSDKEIAGLGVSSLQNNLRKASIPIHHFAGSVLLAVLIFFVYQGEQKDHQKTVEFGMLPQVGDLYVLKLDAPVIISGDEMKYTIIRLESLANDDYVFSPANYAFPNFRSAKSGLTRELAGADAFANDPVHLTLADIHSKVDSGAIELIVREEKK